MSKRDRRDIDGRDRDRRDGDRRDYQPDDEQQRRGGEGDIQEGDSLTALKAILSKVAALLRPLNLTAEESIRLVEQLYGSVLDMDVALAGEADDTRKSSTLALHPEHRPSGATATGWSWSIRPPKSFARPRREVRRPPRRDRPRPRRKPPPARAQAREAGARAEVTAQAPRGGRPQQAPPREDRGPRTPPIERADRAPAERPESEGPEA